MYKKLSLEKTPEEAKAVKERTRSVKFKDESDDTVNNNVENESPLDNCTAESEQKAIRKKKVPLQRSMSVESYEYIDDNELGK